MSKAIKKLLIREANVAFNSILAGIAIGIGCTVNLMLSRTKVPGAEKTEEFMFLAKVFGSIFFGLGLFSVIKFKMWLFTGKVGFIIDNIKKKEWIFFLDLLLCFIFNCVGIGLFSWIVKLSRNGDGLQAAAAGVVAKKRNPNDPEPGDPDYLSTFILSMMCGFMIYIAVRGHGTTEGDFTKDTFIFFAVCVFILSGFEHCIANFSYFVYADIQPKDWFLTIFMGIGNMVGSVILDFLIQMGVKFTKMVEDEKKNAEENKASQLLDKPEDEQEEKKDESNDEVDLPKNM